MKGRNIKLFLCLLAGITATASGSIYADEDMEIFSAEEEISEEEETSPSGHQEEIELSRSQADKLLEKIGNAEGFDVYSVPEDYEEKIWASHGGNPKEREDYDRNAEKTPSQLQAEEEISLVKTCGDFVIFESGKSDASAAFFKDSKCEEGRIYISDAGNYLLTVDEERTKPLKVRKAVSVNDDAFLFISGDKKTLELMNEDYSEVTETYSYSGKAAGKLTYKNSDGKSFAWIGENYDRAYGAFEYAAENENFRMLADKRSALIGLENKKTGYIWWSSPLDAAVDPNATPLIRNELRSSAVVRYGIPAKRNAGNWLRSETDDCKITVSPIENGIRAVYDYSRAGIKFPVDYILEEDCLSASLKISELQETNKSNVTTEITLLGSFGAGSSDEDGYFVIPDGSGALIRFNNGKIQKNTYSRPVYGNDITAVPSRKTADSEQIYLPVYGIVKEDNALLAVASKGDSNAMLNAAVSGLSNSSYNTCGFSFVLRNTDSYYMSGNLTEEITVFQSGEADCDDIQVKYYPISKHNADYSDIAAKYREYLTEDMGVVPKTKENYAPMYIDLYGGTEKKKPVLGIPLTLNTSVTDYSQAEKILSQLNKCGVESMVVAYNNWTDDGIEHKIDTDASPSDTLGGKDGFKSLRKLMDDIGAELYPVSDNRDFYSGNGYYSFTDTAVRVSGSYSRIVSYDRAYGVPDGFRSNKSLLSPSCFGEVFADAAENFCSANLNGIGIGNIAASLYGDYGRKKLSRFDTMNLLTESCEKTSSMLSGGILADGANAYAFPYITHITDVPLSSSRYDIFDEDIPFMQLVLHGIIPYSTEAVNGNADSERLFLEAVASGSCPDFDFIYEDASLLKDTEFDRYFYANYEGWLETSAAEYRIAAEILSPVSSCTIDKYSCSEDGKTAEAVYSDGTVVKVDFAEKTIDCGEKHFDLNELEEKGEIRF